MKKRRIISLLAALIFLSVSAQDLNIHVNQKGKVGFADSKGNVIIKCIYDSAFPFENGIAIVSKSGKYGIINTSGKVVLPLSYSSISPWNDLLLVKSGKKMGLVDRSGKAVLKPDYSIISKTNCYGKALIALGGKATANEKKTYMANAKYGIIDRNGNILVTPKYRGLYEFSFDCKEVYPFYEGKRLEFSYHNTVDTLVTDCSYLGFSKNGFNIYNAGLMDGHGKEVLKAGLYTYIMLPQSNITRYYIVKKKQTLCGYHDLNTGKSFQAGAFNQPLADIKFWSHGDFIGDIAPVNGTSWSFIDKSGKVLRSGYKQLKHSKAVGLWAAQNGSGQWEVFDEKNGSIAGLSNFEEINFPLHEGDKNVYSVRKNGLYGVVSQTGETVVPFEYEMAIGNTYDVLLVKKNGKWGALTPENSSLIAMEYVNILYPSERGCRHFWVQKSDSLYYHLNLSTKKLSKTGYKVATNFKDGAALVVPVDMKLEDNMINRAQGFVPNTAQKTINDADFSKLKGMFGYLIDEGDGFLMEFPVSTLYRDRIVQEIQQKGGQALTATDKKTILLNVTRENRSYDIKSTLDESEWNY